MLAVILLAALSLPDDVGAPPPGHFTLMVSYADRPGLEVRAGVTRWLGVRLDGELGEAPRLGAEVRVAAGDGRGGLVAHTWLAGHIRPLETPGLSGMDVAIGLGVIARWGWVFLRFDGGLAVGFDHQRVSVDGVSRAAIDQQGGLFLTQALTTGVDLGARVRLSAFFQAAVPSTALLATDPTEQETLRETDATLGGRLGVRF